LECAGVDGALDRVTVAPGAEKKQQRLSHALNLTLRNFASLRLCRETSPLNGLQIPGGTQSAKNNRSDSSPFV
jgi:hypothetical protein